MPPSARQKHSAYGRSVLGTKDVVRNPCRSSVLAGCGRHVRHFFLDPRGEHRDLHSFPTRRSSDLAGSSDTPRRARARRRPRPRSQRPAGSARDRSEEHTSELQSQSNHVCRPLPDKNTAPTAAPFSVQKMWFGTRAGLLSSPVAVATFGTSFLILEASTGIYTLSLHDALPISPAARTRRGVRERDDVLARARSDQPDRLGTDRKSTRLNSSHSQTTYAALCPTKTQRLRPLRSRYKRCGSEPVPVFCPRRLRSPRSALLS